MTRLRRGAFDVEAAVPFLAWLDFVAALDYRYDEHVTLIGPPGRGKTTLAFAIADRRRNVVALATKRNDKSLSTIAKRYGYRVQRTAGIPAPAVSRRVMVWPPNRGIVSLPNQRAVMHDVLDQAYVEGNRAILADEVHVLAEFLGCAPRLKMVWTQGRSEGLSLIAGFQRPAWVPRDAYSAATHLFLFGTSDGEDLKRISGLGGLNVDEIRHSVAWLGADRSRWHEFVYVNTRTGNMVRSRFDKSAPVGKARP